MGPPSPSAAATSRCRRRRPAADPHSPRRRRPAADPHSPPLGAAATRVPRRGVLHRPHLALARGQRLGAEPPHLLSITRRGRRVQRCPLLDRGVTKDEYVMTIVDLNNLEYRDKSFVLAQDVAQVFYIKDMSSKPKKRINKQKDHESKRHIVLSGKRNIVGVEDKTDLSEEYNNFIVIPPFEVNIDPCILQANDNAPYLRRNHNQVTFVKRKSVTTNPSCT